MTDAKKTEDQILFGAATEDGGVTYVRKKNGEYETGTAHIAQEGKPLVGNTDVVMVTKHEDDDWWDVKEFETPGATKGPAKVTTNAYRSGWDQLWGSKPDKTLN